MGTAGSPSQHLPQPLPLLCPWKPLVGRTPPFMQAVGRSLQGDGSSLSYRWAKGSHPGTRSHLFPTLITPRGRDPAASRTKAGDTEPGGSSQLSDRKLYQQPIQGLLSVNERESLTDVLRFRTPYPSSTQSLAFLHRYNGLKNQKKDECWKVVPRLRERRL